VGLFDLVYNHAFDFPDCNKPSLLYTIMSSIGPQIPTHLLSNDATEESDPKSASVGPQASAQEEDSDEDDYAPALPPDILAARAAPPAPKVLGPTFPGASASYQDDSDDDDDVGPKPLPAGSSSTSQADGVKQFLELEESRRKRVEVRISVSSLI